jgi:hypothetical protein
VLVRLLISSEEFEVLTSSQRLAFQFSPRAEWNQSSGELPSNKLVPCAAWMQAVWQQRFQVLPRDEFIVELD